MPYLIIEEPRESEVLETKEWNSEKYFSYLLTFRGEIWYYSRRYCLPHLKGPEPSKYFSMEGTPITRKQKIELYIGEIMNKTTFMAKPGQVERKWYVVDATDVPLGRLSAVVASVLRGKTNQHLHPHTDTGDFVIVINAEKVKLTGKKATDKIYYTHSNHPGGLKQISAGELRSKNAVRLIEKSVKGMLPHNTLGRAQGMKLKVFVGAEHTHAAQQPEVLDISGLI